MSQRRSPLLFAPLLLALCGLLLVTGCAPRIPFTHELRREHGLNRTDLQQLQYYTSQPITLHREVPSGSHEVLRGTLKIVSGRRTDEVVIRAGTPGVAVDATTHSILLSFDDSAGSTLEFGAYSPGGRVIGEYRLYGRDWHDDNSGIVKFEGVDYRADGPSSDAYLEIDLSALETFEARRRVLPGRRIPQIEE